MRHILGTSRWRTLAKRTYNSLMGTYIFSKFDKVITICEFEKQLLREEFDLPEDRFRSIGNGVDVHKFEALGRRSQEIDKTYKTMLYVGRLEEYKGVHLIINLLRNLNDLLPEVKLVVVGKGSYKDELVSLVDSLELRDSVSFFEDVSEEGLIKLYASSDVFVSLSQYEALPIALLEAMASGLPTIVTKVGGIPEVIRPNTNGFLVDFPPDSKELARIARLLLEDHGLAIKIGMEAQKTIYDGYSWDEVSFKIRNLYLELL